MSIGGFFYRTRILKEYLSVAIYVYVTLGKYSASQFNFELLILITTSNHMLGKAIWDKLPE